MKLPDRDLILRKRDEAEARLRQYHIRRFPGIEGRLVLISDCYPGVWLEHAYDGVAWANYAPEDRDVALTQTGLFLELQKEDGQLPCFVLDKSNPDIVRYDGTRGYCQIQECVSFGRICIEAADLNQDSARLAYAYEKLRRWDAWLCQHRMTLGTGLIETFCGYDTGHDNSFRFTDIPYPGNYSADGGLPPPDLRVLPLISPDMNAVFYGDRLALAELAERLGKPEEASRWREKAAEVRRRLYDLCFDERDCFFYDVDRRGVRRPCRSVSITNVLCEGLCDGAVTDEIFRRYLNNPAEFGTPYPWPGVSLSDPSRFRNRSGNSWGYFSQGLTALRTLRWMERCGRSAELESLMTAWVEGWCRSPLHFGQELDPQTGEPSTCSQWYSSCMLFFLHSVRRLGIG